VVLLDSDILIDLLRGHPNALAWSRSPRADVVAMCIFSELELLVGCRDLAGQGLIEKFVARCTILCPSPDSMRLAARTYAKLRLRSGIGANDALIAHTAIEHNVPLHTFNVKHYHDVPGLITLQPYTR